MLHLMSTRAQVILRRTYNRPLNDEGTVFETWSQTLDRVINHQQWLWERALGKELNENQISELKELRGLIEECKVFPAGRVLWLGGTEIGRTRESSILNCSFVNVETIYDMVDVLWLLLQGVGVGFSPIIGTLTGFRKNISEIEVIRSKATKKTGIDNNEEIWDPLTKIWTIKVGDSAEAWAKSLGKLVAGKHPADKLILNFSNIRPPGERLKGYGWLSSGDEQISIGFKKIAELLNSRAGQLLTKINILDVVNWLGTILSSRRSAQICLFEYGSPEWEEFAVAKKNYWETGNPQRAQSNNSIAFKSKPSKKELEYIFEIMQDAGGSEPGFINMEAALKRAPFFSGLNPCSEVLLPNKGFCNLTEVDVGKFKNNQTALFRAVYIAARMNYRQTCINLNDGILQEAWNLNNDFLRLCGVGLTGIAKRPDLQCYDYTDLKRTATYGAYGMADELDMPRPKNVTVVKPSGCGVLDTEIKTTQGVKSFLDIFESQDYNKEFLKTLESRTWITPISKLPRVFDENNEEQEIILLFFNGYEEVFKIEFEDGSVYKFTSEHKLKTVTGWKRIDELTLEDEIISF